MKIFWKMIIFITIFACGKKTPPRMQTETANLNSNFSQDRRKLMMGQSVNYFPRQTHPYIPIENYEEPPLIKKDIFPYMKNNDRKIPSMKYSDRKILQIRNLKMKKLLKTKNLQN